MQVSGFGGLEFWLRIQDLGSAFWARATGRTLVLLHYRGNHVICYVGMHILILICVYLGICAWYTHAAQYHGNVALSPFATTPECSLVWSHWRLEIMKGYYRKMHIIYADIHTHTHIYIHIYTHTKAFVRVLERG